tara:strand:- start:2570 stop:2959 length:390 start_codon:yes stop_codon:yes gene_type:complete
LVFLEVNLFKKIFSFGFDKDGLSHWIWQRITAISMIFLFSWIIFSFQKISINPFENFNNWIKSPINLVLFILLFFFVIHHSTLGMLNIFEDYIQSKKRRKFLSFSLKTISFFVLVISILSVWHIYSKVI